MKYWILIFAIFALSACSSAPINQSEAPQGTESPTNPAQQLPAANLEDLGPAPELTNEVWLNTDQALRLADLRGQVVLLEMWTFG